MTAQKSGTKGKSRNICRTVGKAKLVKAAVNKAGRPRQNMQKGRMPAGAQLDMGENLGETLVEYPKFQRSAPSTNSNQSVVATSSRASTTNKSTRTNGKKQRREKIDAKEQSSKSEIPQRSYLHVSFGDSEFRTFCFPIPADDDKSPTSIVRLGRDVEWANIALEDAAVSRKHAEVRFEDGHLWLVDLASRNGTQLDHAPVLGMVPLNKVSRIDICSHSLIFRVSNNKSAMWSRRRKTTEGKDLRTSVFISYAREDVRFARNLSEQIKRLGIGVWFDATRLHGGQTLISAVANAIHDANWFIVIVSRASRKSRWVDLELEIALSKEVEGNQKCVVPIRKDNCKLPMLLRTKHYIDFSKKHTRK